MRRVCALVLSAALLWSLSACAAAVNAAREEPYALYFCRRDLTQAQGGDALGTEPATVENAGELEPQALAQTLMERLLDGPSDERLQSPFPAGTELLSCTLSGSRIGVDLSAAYGTLSDVGLTLADACITLTLTQIFGVVSVCVTVNGQPLAYRNQQVFSADDVLLTSSEDVVASVRVTLYFLNEAEELTGEERTVDLYEGDTQVQVLLQALLAGPQERTLHSALPENFEVSMIWLKDGVCCVNLPGGREQDLPQGREMRLGLTALARSLCSLADVRQVSFLVDGRSADVYCGVLLRGVEQTK